MNGIRPSEVVEILRSVECAGPGPLVLATFVSLDGSVFGRAGAMAVFSSAGGAGVIPFSELQGELRRVIEETAAGGKASLVALDLAEDDPVLGFGLGAPGKVEVFLERVEEELRQHLASVRDTLQGQKGVVCSLVIDGLELGRRALLKADDPQVRECYQEMSPELIEESLEGSVRRTFLCPVHPMGKVLIFGSGPVASVVARHLVDLGFAVFVSDPRRGRLKGAAWRLEGVSLIEGGWEQARAVVEPDEDTSVVVLTRSYALDLETLQGAFKSPASYVGIIGAPKRTQRLLAELAVLETRPRPGVFFAPAGLDLGAETPAEMALAMAAEILAARSGRKGGRLSSRAVTPQIRQRPVAGVVLAGGAGTRFEKGNKLLIPFEGRPVLRHVVENALASRLDPVIVVLGHGASQALEALSGLKDQKLRVVFNPLWEGGKASSLEVALREVPQGAPGMVKLLGDMPLVKPWLIDRVLSELELSGRLVVPVYTKPDGPRRGSPIAIPRRLFGEIRALARDDADEATAQEHWSEALKVPLPDDSTQLDINTAGDAELLSR